MTALTGCVGEVDTVSPSDTSPIRDITESICAIAERPQRAGFWVVFALCVTLLGLLVSGLAHLVGRGIGVWGNDQSVSWAWDIAGFVFWIGIGHAGTLISAVLYLFRQRWRTSINRAAEAVTLIAVVTAAIYPIFHLGRVWLGYWLFPLPNQMLIWPNFRSPLTWDVFAISTYFLVSLMFWYLGLIPDLATLRDRAISPVRRRLLATLSLGWRGSVRHWQLHERAYLVMAGLATPLVVSVHTIVSFDFAVAILPGWHNTIFPPYFVAGAVLSGSAVVALILVLVRRYYALEARITVRHIENLNKLILATSLMVATAYAVEMFLAWFSGDPFEKRILFGRMSGPLAHSFWVMVACNVAIPQLFWVDRLRRSTTATLVVTLAVCVGMWLERFVLVVSGLDRGFLPSTWTEFRPTLVDGATLLGTIGLFASLFLMFLRWVPIMSMNEVKAEVAEADANDTLPNVVGHPQDGAQSVVNPVHHGHDSIREPQRLLLGRCDSLTHLRSARRTIAELTQCRIDGYAPFGIGEVDGHASSSTSIVAWTAGCCGVIGASLAMGIQYWAQAVDYPLQLGGKPIWTWQSAIPITFEVGILAAAIGCVAAFLWACQLPNYDHPLLSCERFRDTTDDGYFVSIDLTDQDTEEPLRALRTAGVRSIIGVGR